MAREKKGYKKDGVGGVHATPEMCILHNDKREWAMLLDNPRT